MRFFFRKKDESRPIDAARRQRDGFVISMAGDYSDMEKNTATLKVWLPESTERHLEELATYLDTSVSDFIRQILFQHLYGRYDLIGLVERQKRNPDEPDVPFEGAKFSLAPTFEPSNNKVAGVKIFIPSRMRIDLEKLSRDKYLTISEYVRLVIMNHLYGTLNSAAISFTVPQLADEGFE
jgi:hypothetical protein